MMSTGGPMSFSLLSAGNPLFILSNATAPDSCFQVIRAEDLPKATQRHLPDVYAEVQLDDQIFRTHDVEHCAQPSWNRIFQL
jgi:Ca2+-dependent lipid-binding protein